MMFFMFDLKSLRKKLGLTQAQMGDILGCGQTNISEIERNGKDLEPDQYNILLEKYGKEEIDKYIQQGIIDMTDIKKKRIPFYDDVATIGGYNHLVADVSAIGGISEWIDAGDWFPEATAAIRHYGDSMLEYPSGSILALKRVEDWRLIIWGKNYVIETTEFRITKRLQDGGADFVLAYSSNQETYPDGRLIHSPIKIPKETIRHIDLVLGCVTKEFSNGPIKISK